MLTGSYPTGWPPVMSMTEPLTKLASSEAKKTKAGESSTGWPGRPIGDCPPNWETVSPSIEAGMIGVHTGPGATQLARSPYCTTSWANPSVKVTMEPLVAEYGKRVGDGLNACAEPTLMIEPPCGMCGMAALTSQNIA